MGVKVWGGGCGWYSSLPCVGKPLMVVVTVQGALLYSMIRMTSESLEARDCKHLGASTEFLTLALACHPCVPTLDDTTNSSVHLATPE